MLPNPTAQQDNVDVYIRTVSDLYSVREKEGLLSVFVVTSALKRRGLLPHAIKFGMWSLAVGGRLEIIDDGPDSLEFRPNQMPFQTVCQTAIVLLRRDAILLGINKNNRSIAFQRALPVPNSLWSAVVMFSGDKSELDQLSVCLAALCAQTEFTSRLDQPIAVCGPAEAAKLVPTSHLIRYLPYDDPGAISDRFRIGRKKNFAVRASAHDKVIVLHSRVILDRECLSRIPKEFDVLGVNVLDRSVHPALPYLSLQIADIRYPGWFAKDFPISVRQIGAHNYLDLFRFGTPYIDGGCVALRKAIIDTVPMSDDLAWGESEDSEWCHRVLIDGFLIDFSPVATASSMTSKFSGNIRWIPSALRTPFLRIKRSLYSILSTLSVPRISL
jgi:hypothetical protein